ncbi:hypothetical protein HY798_00845 [Candidatus Falkowbacteria bacterium]|nr:hypothetical protein [Candidatus Falkowbacteria bacterium]
MKKGDCHARPPSADSLAMTTNMIKNFSSIILLLIFSAIAGCFVLGANFALAASADNVSGWAWSSTIGWISFNGDNPEVPGGGDYGVHICVGDSDAHTGCGAGADGKMVGYAWSENIGWIKFDPVGPYPGAPLSSAQIDASDNVVGWARACAGAANEDCSGGTNPNSGGWDGWIKFYNASVDFIATPAEFHQYAWGSDVLGWVSLNCAEGGISGGNICGQSNYKVVTTYTRPKATNLTVTLYDQCLSPPKYQFSWDYFGTTFDHAQLQIDKNQAFSNCQDGGGCAIDRTVVSSSVGIPLGDPAVQNVSLAYQTSYYWRVKVWDSSGRDSGWVNYDPTGDGAADSFATADHLYPNIVTADLSWAPVKPTQNEKVYFTNKGKCYGAGNVEVNCAWLWTIPNATYVAPTSSISKEPVVVFNQSGKSLPFSVKATDPDGNWCEAAKSIDISVGLPQWKEITPF